MTDPHSLAVDPPHVNAPTDRHTAGAAANGTADAVDQHQEHQCDYNAHAKDDPEHGAAAYRCQADPCHPTRPCCWADVMT